MIRISVAPLFCLAPLLMAAAQTAPSPPLVSVDGLPIGAIPQQELPTGGCTAFLWTQSPSHALIAMVGATPAIIRFAPGGTVTDLVRVGQSGDIQLGLASKTDYAGGDFRVTVDMDIVKRGDMTDGAAVPSATIRVDVAGKDSVVVPAAGIIGCA
ncbi:hypothetical protein [Sphingomonas sp. 28-63-12]|uniref:hypothetical protein n=1 Tax=Sphingomonas sp. 28-63-12 TaxID=1970434 RepID=UPI000BCD8733|nr:MAG: hypothetical protein B7Y47_14185 [Sphingomonas sp. 28-63-12]